MQRFTVKNRLVLVSLICLFSVYNYLVYSGAAPDNSPIMSQQAIVGEQLYQDNNCTACHQLYGLGGYLGPDLTNIISDKGPAYTKAFLNSGVKVMPKFDFTDEEMEAIVQFLSEVDSTGYYPIYEPNNTGYGWVELDYKTRKNEQ